MSLIPEGFIPVLVGFNTVLKKREECTPEELCGHSKQDVFGEITNSHSCVIRKGELGQLSKIQEELDEAIDAVNQGNRILLLIELADIYGALAAVAENSGISMDDLKIQAESKSRLKSR